MYNSFTIEQLKYVIACYKDTKCDKLLKLLELAKSELNRRLDVYARASN